MRACVRACVCACLRARARVCVLGGGGGGGLGLGDEYVFVRTETCVSIMCAWVRGFAYMDNTPVEQTNK